jgi:hypothetical protein
VIRQQTADRWKINASDDDEAVTPRTHHQLPPTSAFPHAAGHLLQSDRTHVCVCVCVCVCITHKASRLERGSACRLFSLQRGDKDAKHTGIDTRKPEEGEGSQHERSGAARETHEVRVARLTPRTCVPTLTAHVLTQSLSNSDLVVTTARQAQKQRRTCWTTHSQMTCSHA